MEADISSQAVGLASSTDFSIVTLFLRADVIVKTVILILIASSIYSWAIIIEKLRLFKQIVICVESFFICFNQILIYVHKTNNMFS